VSVFLASDGPLSMDAELEALRLGVADHFTKPLDPALLAKRIAERPRLAARGSLADLPDEGISGDLALHDVMHLLQLCHRHRMNARLHVELDGDWGVMLVRHGELIDAESPSSTGREAVFAAIRRAKGAFVLFPLALDADELSREDVIRADLATVFTEALGRPEPRTVRAEPVEVEVSHPESPRGPLSKRGPRPRTSPANDTLEYHAAPPGAAPTGEKPRVKRQVGVPTVEPEAPKAAEHPTEEKIGAPAPRVAVRTPLPEPAPEPEPEAEVEIEVAVAPTDVETMLEVESAVAAEQVVETVRDEPPFVPLTDQDIIETLPASAEVSPPTARSALAGAELRRRVAADTGERTVLSTPKAPEPAPAAVVAQAAPATSESARVMRSQLPADEPELDEPTDLSAKSPVRAGARVRRPPTGRFDIGDPNIPPEVTAVEAPTIDGGASPVRGEAVRAEPPPPVGRPFPWLVAALGVVLAAVTIFVVAKLATKEPAPPPAPSQVAPTLSAEEEAQVRFGEAVMALDAGDDAKAEKLLTALLEGGNNSDGVMAGLVRLYVADGRLKEAEQLLGALGRQRPEDARVQALLGVVMTRRGQPEEAARAFARARELAPAGPLADRLEALTRPSAPPPEPDSEPSPAP
ncbi:MAG: tetratricopeptide repeat protein, partial [Myxococcales bacterium]|nr:tetratricopeptide repeat protein [Myxococcales bacterium]